MDSSPSLSPGSIKGIDHITFGYPRLIGKPSRMIHFFASLGVSVTLRDEPRRIDNFLPGARYDFPVGDTVVTFAPGMSREILLVMLARHVCRFRSHLAFTVQPRVFDELLDHHAVDFTLGEEGRVRWGSGDWSVFLNAPYGLRFEFRCPTAHHIDP